MVVKKQSTKTAQLYAYSFDRETWQGDFNSREEAMQAAISDEHNKGCLVVYTGIAKLYTPALKSVLWIVTVVCILTETKMLPSTFETKGYVCLVK